MNAIRLLATQSWKDSCASVSMASPFKRRGAHAYFSPGFFFHGPDE